MRKQFISLICLILLSSMNSKLNCQNMTQQDGRKMLHIMNNLESTTELNGVLQKNIEWHKSQNDTLKHILRKREEQLLSANYKLTEHEKTMFKLRVYNISITITSLFFLILLASK